MIKLLLVEDEIGIMALLKNLIQFQKLGLELAGTASTGREALELMKETDPDIVITDICMPQMGGLELIEAAKEQNLKAKYVIVSGYSQFDYAVTAIKLGVEDYLLKPINEAELNEVLEKLTLNIQSANDAAYSLKRMNTRIKNQRKKLRKRLFLDLLFGSRSLEARTLKEINGDYGYGFQEETVFLVGIVRIDGVQDWNLVAKKTFLEQLARIFSRETAGRCLEKEACIYNDFFLYLINVSPDKLPEIRERINEIWRIFKRLAGNYENLRLTMGCGYPADAPGKIEKAFQSAKKVLSCRILEGCGKIYRAEEYASAENGLTEQLLVKSRLKIQTELQNKRPEECRQKIREYLEWVIQVSRQSPLMLLENLEKSIYYLISDMSWQKGLKEDAEGTFRQMKDSMERCSGKEELLDLILERISGLSASGEDSREKDVRTIARAKDYIWTHYQENLRLEDVAEQVYLTPGYFGVLFKKETGTAFSAYVIQVRVEKAKELLRDPRRNISEVAYAVGYQDVRHFSRLFKEYVGLVPKEYRKLHGSGLF